MMRTVLLSLSTALVLACGGPRLAGPTAPPGPSVTAAVPAVDALDTTRQARPETLNDAILASWVHELAGDPAMAARVVADAPAGPPALEVGRWLRLHALRNDVPDYEQVVSGALGSRPGHPLGRVLRADLEWVLAYRAHRYAMTDEPFAAPHLGAPARWRAVGPLSNADVLDAGAMLEPDRDDALADAYTLPGGTLTTVETATRASGVELPAGPVGIYYLEAFVEVEATTRAIVAVSSSARYRVTIDGVDVVRREVDGLYESQLRLAEVELGPGRHRVLVQVATTGTRTLSFRLVPTDGGRIVAFDTEPGAVSGEVLASDPAGVAPLELLDGLDDSADDIGWLIRSDAAVVSSDGLGAQALIERGLDAEPHPIRALALIRLAEVLWTRRPQERDDIATAAIRDATGLWPGAVRLVIARAGRLHADGRIDEAVEILERVVQSHPDVFAAWQRLADLQRELGFDELALVSHRRAASLFPSHCPNVRALVDAMDRRGEAVSPDILPEAWLRCDVAWEALIDRWWLPRGDVDEALAAARRLAVRNPLEVRHVELWLDLALAAGDDAEVDAARAFGARSVWGAADRAIEDADLALASGRRADAVDALDALVADAPTNLDRRALRARVTGDPVFAELRHDGLEQVRAWDASGATASGAVVYVFDYGAFRWFDDGSRVDLVHQIVRLQTRDALAEYGEVGVPADALLLTVRTIKADGRTLVPEDIAGKTSISMPDLEIGDYIELEWAQSTRASDIRNPVERTSRFYFQVPGASLWRSVAAYAWPSEWDDEVQFDLRNFDGRDETTRSDGVTTRTFTAIEMPPPVEQPRAVGLDEWFPSVRFGRGTAAEASLRAYANLVPRTTVATSELRDAVHELTDGAGSDRERAHRIFRYVVDEIPDFGGFFSEPAAWTWATHEGERLALIWTLFEIAELEPQLVFVRPLEQDPTPSDVFDLSVYDLTTIRIVDGRDEIWLEPEFDDWPFDYVRPEAQGQPAIVVAGPDAGAELTTPVWPLDVEQNRIEMTIEFDENGDAVIEVDETIPLRTAAGFRYFVEATPDMDEMMREVERSLAGSFPGVQMTSMEFGDVDDADLPVRMSYRFVSAGLARVDGDELIMETPIFERALASAWAGQPTVDHPVLVSFPVREVFRMTLVPPAGWSIASVPDPVTFEEAQNRFRRSWSLDGERAVLERVIELPVQRVAVERYVEFAAFLQASQAGADVAVRMTPGR